MSDEKRGHRRVYQFNVARIRTDRKRSAVHYASGIPAETLDISLSGARMRSLEPFAAGDTLRIQLDLFRIRQTIVLDGIVRWVRREKKTASYEFGVEFQGLVTHTMLSLVKDLGGPMEVRILPASPP